MRWEDERESSNVEDARGFSIGGRGAGIGCGGLVIILLVSWLTGINPLQLLNIVQSASPTTSQAPCCGSRWAIRCSSASVSSATPSSRRRMA